MRRLLFVLCIPVSAIYVSGCMVGPRYQRPAANAPEVYRGATAPDAALDIDSQNHPSQMISVQELERERSKTTSLGDEKWTEVFRDPTLQRLIREALANNYDVRIAAQRVLEQQDQVGITRAQQFPTVNGGGSYTAVGLPSALVKRLNSGGNPNGNTSSSFYAGGFTLSAAWNLDFWGLYRRQTEAARAQLLATEWGRRMTISTVVETVATAYLQLQTLGAELEITKQTLEARKQSLELTTTAGWIGYSGRCSPGGTAVLHGSRGNTRLRKTDRAAGEQHQHSAGAESRPYCPRGLRDELAAAG